MKRKKRLFTRRHEEKTLDAENHEKNEKYLTGQQDSGD